MRREGPEAAKAGAQCTYVAVKYVGSENGAGREVWVYGFMPRRFSTSHHSLSHVTGLSWILIELLSSDNGYLLGLGHTNISHDLPCLEHKARHRTAVLLSISVACFARCRYSRVCGIG